MAAETTCSDQQKQHEHDEEGAHHERLQRAQWLRAAILGANDGLLSTTSLMLGINAAKEDRWSVILSGLAGAIAGACSMAVGEFVSVSTQRDIEKMNFHHYHHQNSEPQLPKQIIQGSGNSPIALNQTQDAKVTIDHELPHEHRSPGGMTPNKRRLPILSPGRSPMMMVISSEDEKRARDHHHQTPGEEEEDEMGKSTLLLPSPIKAAVASGLAFLCGSSIPLVSAMFITENKMRVVMLTMVTSISLVVFGGVGAHLGGSPMRVSAFRVLLGGWIAMAITYGLLKPFDRDDDRTKVAHS